MSLTRQEIEDRLTRIAAVCSEGYARRALELARATKAEMAGPPDPDPGLLGWFRFYEVKTLHMLQRWAEIDALFRRPEATAYEMPMKNAAWVCSVAAEAAAELGLAEEVAERCEGCYWMRMNDDDPVSAVMALQTACVLLGRLGRPELNTAFAGRLIHAGRSTGAGRAVVSGLQSLADNYERSRRTTIRRRLENGRTLLRTLREPELADEVRRALDRLGGLLG